MIKKILGIVFVVSMIGCSKGLKPDSTVKKESNKTPKELKDEKMDTTYPIEGNKDFMLINPHKETIVDTTKKSN